MNSSYTAITGDPSDFTLDRLAETLGRTVVEADTLQIIDDLERQLAEINVIAVEKQVPAHYLKKGTERKLIETARHRAASISRRIEYYSNLNWPD